MQDRFKFRGYHPVIGEVMDISEIDSHKRIAYFTDGDGFNIDEVKLMQSTGLKDKNGLNLLFESDIINTEGIKIGNCYENEYLLKDTTNFVIKGMGTKEWRNSEQEAIKRGCYYAE